MGDRKPRKGQKRLRLDAVNVDYVEYQLLNILARDVRHLLEKVRLQILNKDQAQSLVNYLKLTKELKKQKLQELENMSEDELKKLVNT